MLGVSELPATTGTAWYWWVIGYGGQAVFAARFIVQWLASEKAGRSVVPAAFWSLSLAGGLLLLAYAIYRGDPVFILAQSTGTFIYLRNMQLIERGRAAGAT